MQWGRRIDGNSAIIFQKVFKWGRFPPRFSSARSQFTTQPNRAPVFRYPLLGGPQVEAVARIKHLCGGTHGELWIDDCGMRIEERRMSLRAERSNLRLVFQNWKSHSPYPQPFSTAWRRELHLPIVFPLSTEWRGVAATAAGVRRQLARKVIDIKESLCRALGGPEGPAGLPADPADRHRAVRQRGEQPSPKGDRPEPELERGRGERPDFFYLIYCYLFDPLPPFPRLYN
jgi:hypothetical protein